MLYGVLKYRLKDVEISQLLHHHRSRDDIRPNDHECLSKNFVNLQDIEIFSITFLKLSLQSRPKRHTDTGAQWCISTRCEPSEMLCHRCCVEICNHWRPWHMIHIIFILHQSIQQPLSHPVTQASAFCYVSTTHLFSLHQQVTAFHGIFGLYYYFCESSAQKCMVLMGVITMYSKTFWACCEHPGFLKMNIMLEKQATDTYICDIYQVFRTVSPLFD